jgi:hypothetical protein
LAEFRRGRRCERSAEKVLRLSAVDTQLAPTSPVFSWLVLSLMIVIWPSEIAQVEAGGCNFFGNRRALVADGSA